MYIVHHLILTTALPGKNHDSLCKKVNVVTCLRVQYGGTTRVGDSRTRAWTTSVYTSPTCGGLLGDRRSCYEVFCRRSPDDQVWSRNRTGHILVTGIYWGDIRLQAHSKLNAHKNHFHHALQWLPSGDHYISGFKRWFPNYLKSWPHLKVFKISPNYLPILLF